jgi:hypothetical protein
MMMIFQYQDSAFKIGDAEENGIENKMQKALKKLKEKQQCLHMVRQFLTLRLYDDTCALSKQMSAWFKFINYRGSCYCKVIVKTNIPGIFVGINFAFAVVLYISLTMLPGYLIV